MLDSMTGLSEAITLIESRLGPAAVILFGSAARGLASEASDLDLAILPATPVEPMPLLDTACELEARLGVAVDLVDLSGASPILCAQILKHGKVLQAADRRKLGAFIARALSEYDDLKAVRAPIEARLIGLRNGR